MFRSYVKGFLGDAAAADKKSVGQISLEQFFKHTAQSVLVIHGYSIGHVCTLSKTFS